jgi:hypothetical protein
MHPIALPVNDAVYFTATSRCFTEPSAPYLGAARNKCETWLRRQNSDTIPPKEITLIESSSPRLGSPLAISQFTLVHLEQQTSVTVNVSVIVSLLACLFLRSLKCDDPSFSLQSTWVTMCLQEAFQEARWRRGIWTVGKTQGDDGTVSPECEWWSRPKDSYW